MKIVLFFITFYQVFLSKIISQMLGVSRMCRYDLSCSEYAKQSIKKHGVVQGVHKTTKRIISCQPFQLKMQNSKFRTITQKLKVLKLWASVLSFDQVRLGFDI